MGGGGGRSCQTRRLDGWTDGRQSWHHATHTRSCRTRRPDGWTDGRQSWHHVTHTRSCPTWRPSPEWPPDGRTDGRYKSTHTRSCPTWRPSSEWRTARRTDGRHHSTHKHMAARVYSQTRNAARTASVQPTNKRAFAADRVKKAAVLHGGTRKSVNVTF